MSTEPTANILIVDDDRKTLLGMEAMLSAPGRQVVTATSGQEALRWLLRRDFSLILLDVRMPGMDGFETADLIRKSERLRHIPIIFLSAIDTLEADVHRGAAKGAVDYLFKPVVPEVLRAKVAVFVDLFRMNERVKQQAIQQSDERFQIAVEASPNAMIMVGKDGRIVLANAQAERLFGYTREEILCQSIDALVPERFRGKHSDLRAGFFSYPKSRPMGVGLDLFAMRKDGSEVCVEIGLNPIRINEVTFVLVSIIDMTNRKRTEEALRESEQKLRQQAQELEQQLIASGRLVSLGEITASMAHEFNNPLGIVMGFAQLLLTETDPASSHYQSLKIIDQETKRCQSIIQDLLQYARPRSVEFAPTDVEQAVQKTLNLVSSHLIKQKIGVTTEIEPNLPQIHADAQQLEQVMLNLYLNAIDAMPNGGWLTVAAKRNENGAGAPAIVIVIADTGFGIDEKDLPKIFLPFFSVKKRKGLGLGLPICERIVKNHGGKIAVESQASVGTTFNIYLPLNHQPVSSQPSIS